MNLVNHTSSAWSPQPFFPQYQGMNPVSVASSVSTPAFNYQPTQSLNQQTDLAVSIVSGPKMLKEDLRTSTQQYLNHHRTQGHQHILNQQR
jgi:hypothetical protein